MKPWVLVIITTLLAWSTAYAQGGNTGNGGDLSEIDLKKMAMKLPYYINQPSIRNHFPEIDYATFLKLSVVVNIGIVDEDLYDKKGRKRTGKNLTVGHEPWVYLQRKAIEKYSPKNKNVGTLYVFLFHELLNLMDLELTDDIPFVNDQDPALFASIYPISSRILLIADELETFQPLELDFSKYQFGCQEMTTAGTENQYAMFLQPNGEIEVRTILNQMFKWEEAFPRTAKKYNERIRYTMVDPKRIIYKGIIPGFRLDSVTQFKFVGKVTQPRADRRFKKPGYISFQGNFALVDRFSRVLTGQVFVSPSESYGFLKGTGGLQFNCYGSPATP